MHQLWKIVKNSFSEPAIWKFTAGYKEPPAFEFRGENQSGLPGDSIKKIQSMMKSWFFSKFDPL